ncbi:DUF6318 family protein [Phycicoccus sp. Root101]|uniref:DUF6318 family protein n=1 Tax=Phycicoccus sp. Root101 TaxID=1736421 RepID=UPI000B215045|nr:DUF6318 family protein [Phycicoccus sp. Root101]
MAVPPAASKKTPEGAEAFARFYTETLGDAAATSSTKSLAPLSMMSCKTCQDFIQILDGRASRGEHGERSSFRLGAVQMDPGSPLNAPIVDVLVTDQGSLIVDRNGKVVETSAPAKLNFRYTLKWSDESWRVADSEVVQ